MSTQHSFAAHQLEATFVFFNLDKTRWCQSKNDDRRYFARKRKTGWIVAMKGMEPFFIVLVFIYAMLFVIVK